MMNLYRGNVRIEVVNVVRSNVSAPTFPCRRVSLSVPCEDPRSLAMKWIENRSADHWALISGDSLASEIHGWVALEVLLRNQSRNTMKSNSMDGEFIRLLSGTHHIATSFKRAGLREGDKTAWMVDLSAAEDDEMFLQQAQIMGFKLLDDRPHLEIFDSERLGIEGQKSEDGAIGHIHLADLR